jgi:quercetin dioxygenase-like cupin family protein
MTMTLPVSPDAFPDLMRVNESDVPFFDTAEPGLRRRILAHNDKLMLVEHRMEAGWAGARHSHPQDQLVYVISGHLRFSAGDQSFEVKDGDSFVVKGGVEHQAWAIEPSSVLDIFTPYRPDYVSKP